MQNTVIRLLFIALLSACVASVQAQLLLPGTPQIQNGADPIDQDPDLSTGFAEDTGNVVDRSPNCSQVSNDPCLGVSSFNFSDPSVDTANSEFSFTYGLKGEVEPEGVLYDAGTGMNTGTPISESNLGNVPKIVFVFIHHNSNVFGVNTFGQSSDPQCTVVGQGNFGDTARYAAPVVNVNTSNIGVVRYDTAQTNPNARPFIGLVIDPDTGLPSATYADTVIPTDRFLPVARVTCPFTQTDGPVQIAFQANSVDSPVIQLVGNTGTVQEQQAPNAGRAVNSFWYYPLDGAPSILDAQMGHGRGPSGEFYIDLTFSEAVRAAGGSALTEADFPASMFSVHQVDGSVHSGQTVIAGTETSFTGGPIRIATPEGGSVTLNSEVVRLFFAGENHPAVLETASAATVLRVVKISPATPTATIHDADGGFLHAGEDWNLLVRHDNHAPYISQAEVGPASTYLDLTFNEGVKFERDIANTSLVPDETDFEVIRYRNGSRMGSIGISTVTQTVGGVTEAGGVTKVRLHLEDGGTAFTTSDTVDIRIAEQVKELEFPSLASVFDLTQTKGNSNFPRTAAPAQIGSLPLRGRDTYTIAFIGRLDDAGSMSVQNLDFDIGARALTSPLNVDEGNTGGGPGIGIRIQREDTAELQTVGLQIANLDSDNSVAVAVDGTVVTDISAEVTVSFGIGESSKLVTVKVTGNEDGDGDRAYTFRLATDPATQIEGTVGGIRLNITDDDDVAAVLEKGASPESAVGQTEAGLQTGSVRIDSGATVTEGDNVDGVARMIIDVDIRRADGFRDVSSPRNYLSVQGRSPLPQSGVFSIGGINYQTATISNDLVVTLSGSGQERLDRAQVLVRALNFFLPADDRDIGNSATVSISLVPPSSAGNRARSTQTYTINITPNDAPELLPDGEEPLEVTLTESDSFIVQTTVTSGGGGTEGGQVDIRPTGITFQRYDSAGPEVSGFGHVESLSYVSGVGIPVALLVNGNPMERRLNSNSPVQITLFPTQALREEFNGIVTLTIALTDAQGETASREIEWTVDAVNDPLSFNIVDCSESEDDCTLSVDVGEAETFIAGVADRDVDTIRLGSSTLAGNSGNYFRTGDTMTVTFSLPDDEEDDDGSKTAAIVRDSRIAFRNDATQSGVSGGIQKSTETGTVSFTLMFTNVNAADARAIFEALEISVADTSDYSGPRTVVVSAATSANDGRLGNEPVDDFNNGIKALSVRTFILESERCPIVLDAGDDTDADGDCVPDNLAEEDETDMMTLQVFRVDEGGNPVPAPSITIMADLSETPTTETVVRIQLGELALQAAEEMGENDESDYSAAIRPDTNVYRMITTDTTTGGQYVDPLPRFGIFDYTISGLNPEGGGKVAIVIPLLNPVPAEGEFQVQKLRGGIGGVWSPFVTDRDNTVRSAPDCSGIENTPELSADVNGFVMVGQNHGCLLIEISDGGPNDSDGSVNGIIADPIALATIPVIPTLMVSPSSFTLTNTESTQLITFEASGFASEDGRSVRIILKRSEEIILDPSWFDVSRSNPTVVVTVRLVSEDDLIDPHSDDLPYTDLPLTFQLPSVEFQLDEEGLLLPPSNRRGETIFSCIEGGCAPSPTSSNGGGGGGTMEPIWLLLLALAMTLPYGLRRRQSSPFISDL